MKRTCGFLVCTFIVTSACARKSEPAAAVDSTPQKPFSYEERVGMVIMTDKSTGCLMVFNSSVNPGTKVVLVDQPDPNQFVDKPSVNDASVVQPVPENCSDKPPEIDKNGKSPSFYRIQTSVKEWEANDFVIGILEPPSPIVLRDGKVEGDLDGDGTNESFHVCPSSEGLHYQVWTGPPLEGRKRWHRYVYLGEAVTPTCTEKDILVPK